MTPPMVAAEAPLAPPRFRPNGRLAPKLRATSVRSASGRGWSQLAATDKAVARALGVDRRNAGRRRAGEAGPYAATCEEVYRLETAGISTYALTAHLKTIAMQARLADVPTEDLLARLRELQEQEQEIGARLDCTQVHWLVSNAVSLEEFRDRAAAQAAISEEMVALLDELSARRKD